MFIHGLVCFSIGSGIVFTSDVNKPHFGKVEHEIPDLKEKWLEFFVFNLVNMIELFASKLRVHPTLDMCLFGLFFTNEGLDLFESSHDSTVLGLIVGFGPEKLTKRHIKRLDKDTGS